MIEVIISIIFLSVGLVFIFFVLDMHKWRLVGGKKFNELKRQVEEMRRDSIDYDMQQTKRINELENKFNLILSHFKLKEWTEAEKKVLITEEETYYFFLPKKSTSNF